ncbi:hypothetical protein SNE25_13410 [Mucilaginibacter sabulilitoris]|uniref:Uncharacterized protein n=1 Tax=Mucilaginibacter sabulilitoris TaxID=1173583 RepID=A0ABZ0TUU0_9SPHI|nr:hypothetical protein [Mucilaginibacter sabulilitoris]WPU96516.1 hypothetical protein SNE25_13410 [Mucilaginibacter sabulilitoris]
MYIAYSALNAQQSANDADDHNSNTILANHEPLLRYQAYQATVRKYSKEIEAIQKYLPDWMSAFR